MESSKGESEKSQSIKLNVILSVPPLFYILYPPLEPFCHPPPFRQKGAFLSYRKLCFHTIKKLRLGCALGAGVDGCRSNRASARECAKAHSFFSSYRKLRFYTIKNAPRGSHFGGEELCRLRDPPQAENPAEQDSIVVLCGSDRFQQERVGDAWDALPLVVARFGKQRTGGNE